jgi:hypothetical protein
MKKLLLIIFICLACVKPKEEFLTLEKDKYKIIHTDLKGKYGSITLTDSKGITYFDVSLPGRASQYKETVIAGREFWLTRGTNKYEGRVTSDFCFLEQELK